MTTETWPVSVFFLGISLLVLAILKSSSRCSKKPFGVGLAKKENCRKNASGKWVFMMSN